MFTFQPKSDEELSNLLAVGEAQFEVMDALFYTKNGAPILKLTIKAWDTTGKEKIIIDYITANADWKIKNFCYSCGLNEDYDHGSLSPEKCIGKMGVAKVDVEIDKAEKYPPKNKIRNYVRTKAEKKSNFVPESELPNDDIPF